MKVTQVRDLLTHRSSRKPSRQGSQLPETLFWPSLQPSVIFFTEAKEYPSS